MLLIIRLSLVWRGRFGVLGCDILVVVMTEVCDDEGLK